jgi:hypothetical protein
MTAPFGALAFVLTTAIFTARLVSWRQNRVRGILDRRAAESRFVIVDYKWRPFGGPFFWSTLVKQNIYSVRVKDADGCVRCAWVRCGSWALGILEERTEVKWEPR